MIRFFAIFIIYFTWDNVRKNRKERTNIHMDYYDNMINTMASEWIARTDDPNLLDRYSLEYNDIFKDFCDGGMDENLSIQHCIETSRVLSDLYYNFLQNVQTQVYNDVADKIQQLK